MSRRDVSVISALVNNLPRSKKFLVAVSGGIDSVVLLDALVRVQKLLKADIAVAHVDHGLRTDSTEDLEFVEKLASKSQIRFFSTKLERPAGKHNIEDWGRKERYRFFKKILAENEFDFILTAHHSSDVAENFLMKLISNKELRGIHKFNRKHSLLRPLLHISKNQILAHQTKYLLEYRTDSSNQNNSFLRNKVRNRLIPMLEEEFQKKAQVFLAERANELAEDLEALDAEAHKYLAQIADKSLQESKDLICSLTTPISWRVIDLFFLSRLAYRPGRSKCLLIRQVLLGRLRKLDLPGGLRLYWHKKALLLEPNCQI